MSKQANFSSIIIKLKALTISIKGNTVKITTYSTRSHIQRTNIRRLKYKEKTREKEREKEKKKNETIKWHVLSKAFKRFE